MNQRHAQQFRADSPHILVITDSSATRKLLQDSLEAAAYHVDHATDGRTAIAYMRGNLPDLVIQDVLVPDMHYLDLHRQLRELDTQGELPMLALAAATSPHEETQLLASGFNTILAKPIDTEKLVQVVQTYLPISSQPAAQIGLGRRVLVADDEPIQRKLLTYRLEQLGFSVIAADNGAAALEEALRSQPDAIISDVLMPQLDGFGLCRAVRREPALARVPVILASASYDEQADRTLALSLGANAFVIRTPDFGELIDALLATFNSESPLPAALPSEVLSEEHVQRVVRQLERQTNANASLSHGAAMQAAQLSILAEVSEILTRNMVDIDQALNQVLTRCLDGVGTPTGAVYLIDQHGTLSPRASIGYPSTLHAQLADFFGYAALLHRTLDTGEPLGVPSAQVSADLAGSLLAQALAGSLLITPLISNEQRLGVVVMGSNSTDLEEDWFSFAKAVGYQISQAIALGRMVTRLATSEQRYRTLVQDVDAIVWELDVATGQFLFVSRRAEELLGHPLQQWYDQHNFFAEHIHPDDRNQVLAYWQHAMRDGRECAFDHRMTTRDGHTVWLRTTMHVTHDSQQQIARVSGLMIDITDQKRLEEQFRQAQKMEAIGRLAGGVAHDFNNLLTAITGYSEFLLNDIDRDDPRRSDVEEIQNVAERAARLTRQLLTFSRRQALAPQELGLNDVITNMEQMLRRLIGEDIELVTVLDPALGHVRADLSQIEQVILNLVVNARDAMPNGGKVTIETARMQIDRSYATWYMAVDPGQYALLAVSDTGYGIPAEVRAQIFEPFFTTKERGKGTGLGLSTVYGIVRQSGGDIFVYSEPGYGAAFKLYFPEVLISPDASPDLPAMPQLTGWETVLLVEDEEGVRSLVWKILQRNGYSVLSAPHGAEAIALAQRHRGPIHLLLTDVVMPGMNGRELAEYLLPLRPEMRVLYMSGYTDSAIVHHDVLEAGALFLQKPFAPDTLSAKVRQALDPSVVARDA